MHGVPQWCPKDGQDGISDELLSFSKRFHAEIQAIPALENILRHSKMMNLYQFYEPHLQVTITMPPCVSMTSDGFHPALRCPACDMSLKYLLKSTSERSGGSFSTMVVKDAMSEKNIVTCVSPSFRAESMPHMGIFGHEKAQKRRLPSKKRHEKLTLRPPMAREDAATPAASKICTTGQGTYFPQERIAIFLRLRSKVMLSNSIKFKQRLLENALDEADLALSKARKLLQRTHVQDPIVALGLRPPPRSGRNLGTPCCSASRQAASASHSWAEPFLSLRGLREQ